MLFGPGAKRTPISILAGNAVVSRKMPGNCLVTQRQTVPCLCIPQTRSEPDQRSDLSYGGALGDDSDGKGYRKKKAKEGRNYFDKAAWRVINCARRSAVLPG